jgi:hypothetical protein
MEIGFNYGLQENIEQCIIKKLDIKLFGMEMEILNNNLVEEKLKFTKVKRKKL